MARSCSYPTQYRCGSFSGKDVYWSPSQGWAIEDDHWHLVQHALDPGVRFFHDAEDFGVMEDDVEENDGLFDAMPCDLREAFIAEKEKRIRWAEEDAIESLAKEQHAH